MTRSRAILAVTVLSALVLAVLITPSAHTQPQGLTPKPLLRTTLSGDDTKEAMIATVEFAPGGTTNRHTHPGDEYAVVLEGTLELRVEGQEPRRVSAGEAYHMVRGVIHETRNVGDGLARIASTLIFDKGKPTYQPAQQ